MVPLPGTRTYGRGFIREGELFVYFQRDFLDTFVGKDTEEFASELFCSGGTIRGRKDKNILSTKQYFALLLSNKQKFEK